MKRQHSRWSPWTVVLAANALVDEETSADRADLHAGVVVGLSADQLTGRRHQALRLTPATIAAYAGKYGVNPPIQRESVTGLIADLPTYYVFGQKRMKRAIA